MERNIRLIPVHEAVASSMVWIPIFVLFTRARFDLNGALLLASLYYLFVVALEVPSGWFSDHVGRVFTLRIAAAAWTIAHLCFLFGDTQFSVILVGQFFMAIGFASLSGTDVSFHYDTLEALGDAETYERRQARVSSIGFASLAVAVLVGAAVGLIDLRVPFAIAAALAAVQFGVTMAMTEPPHVHDDPLGGSEVGQWLSYLRDKPLAWLFLYGTASVTLVHVAFTLLQPWLTDVLDQSVEDLGATPLISGVVFASASGVGAIAALASAPVSERIGPAATLIGLGALSAVVVSAMAASTNPAIIAVVILRSIHGAAATVLISAAAAPRLERNHRATFLSLNSLSGRIGYGLILLTIAAGTNDDVSGALLNLTIIAWVLVAITFAMAPILQANRLRH